MAELILEIPSENVFPTEKYNADLTEKEIKARYPKYEKYFTNSSVNSKVNKSIVVGFAYACNGLGQVDTPDNVGVMFWNKIWVSDALVGEYKLNRLTEEEKSIFKKYAIKFSKKGINRPITYADAQNPELNVTIGAIIIGQLIDNIYYGEKDTTYNWSVIDGKVRLDKILTMYLLTACNSFPMKEKELLNFVRSENSKNTSEFLKNSKEQFPKVTLWYKRVQLLLCKNGYMELIVKMSI